MGPLGKHQEHAVGGGLEQIGRTASDSDGCSRVVGVHRKTTSGSTTQRSDGAHDDQAEQQRRQTEQHTGETADHHVAARDQQHPAEQQKAAKASASRPLNHCKPPDR